MRAFLLTIFLVILSWNGKTQTITEFELDGHLKANYLTKIFALDNYCIFPDYHSDTIISFILTHEQSIQFYASDSNDTLLIFDGKLCGGHESGVVNIYKFIDGKPETLLAKPGRVAGFQDAKIWIYSYPCCAEVLNILAPFSALTGEKLGDAHIFYSKIDFTTIFPIRRNKTREYELTKDSEMRWSPFTSEESHAPVCGSNENIIGNIAKGTHFSLIEVSSNGWALIRLDNQLTSEGYCLKKYHQSLIGGEQYALYGWIPIKNISRE